MKRARAAVAVVAAVAAIAVGATACSGSGRRSSARPAGAPASAPTTTERPPLRYVSLGDSYPAGEGLPAPVPPCGRAPGAYPSLVAQQAGLAVSLHACNGATTADVLGVARVPVEGRQIDAVSPDTGVVTISIGGNDLGFAQIMADCVLNSLPCSRLDSQVEGELAALRPRLAAIFRDIGQRAPGARLLVVGYPQLVVDPDRSGLSTCAGLTADESRWVRQKGDELATAIRAAAESAGARYLDAAAAFAGHESCAPQPWMEGVNLVNIGASFHPNAAGHEELARLVEAALPAH